MLLSNNGIKSLWSVFPCGDDKFFHTKQNQKLVAKVSRINRLSQDFVYF